MVADAEKPLVSDSPASAFVILSRLFREASEYGQYYFRAQLAKVSLALSKIILIAVLALAGGLVGLAIVVTAGVLVVRGVAELLTILFGGHAWAGDLVTGAMLLVAVVAGSYFGTLIATRGLRAGYKESLEALRKHQQETLGTDVRERADATWEKVGENHVR